MRFCKVLGAILLCCFLCASYQTAAEKKLYVEKKNIHFSSKKGIIITDAKGRRYIAMAIYADKHGYYVDSTKLLKSRTSYWHCPRCKKFEHRGGEASDCSTPGCHWPN